MNYNSSHMNKNQDNPILTIPGINDWLSVVSVFRSCERAMQRELSQVGLSLAQYDILACLLARNGRTQQEIAQRNFVVKSNVSGLVDRMQARGWLERRADEGDARKRRIFLTDDGTAMALQGLEIQKKMIAVMSDAITREQGEVTGLTCQLMQAAIEKNYNSGG